LSIIVGFVIKLQPLLSIIIREFQLGSICPRMAEETLKDGQMEPKGIPKGTKGAQRTHPRVPKGVKRNPKSAQSGQRRSKYSQRKPKQAKWGNKQKEIYIYIYIYIYLKTPDRPPKRMLCYALNLANQKHTFWENTDVWCDKLVFLYKTCIFVYIVFSCSFLLIFYLGLALERMLRGTTHFGVYLPICPLANPIPNSVRAIISLGGGGPRYDRFGVTPQNLGFPIFHFSHIWIFGHAETAPRHISRFHVWHFEKSTCFEKCWNVDM